MKLATGSLLGVVVALLGHDLVATASPNAATSCDSVSITQFLTPEGRVDMAAVRASGYEGPLSMAGRRSWQDPATGEPLFVAPAASAAASVPDDVYWQEGFGFPGLYGPAYAAVVYDGKLIVGGSFNAAGSVLANNIAAWDGLSWSALESGVNGDVLALTVFNSQLIAGGFFTTAGEAAANKIAAWDGSSWSALGSGLGNVVSALTVFNSQLIAGGAFMTAGGTAASRIAAWDGSSWSTLGTGMNNEVQALRVFNSQLIAGGQFTNAGGTAANRIAAWDGSTWSPLGSGTNNHVYTLTVFNSQLIAGGRFSSAGGATAYFIAAWNGSSWSALGAGMNGNVHTLAVFDTKLIAGGDFTHAGSIPSYFRAAWDGSSWSSIGGLGFDAPVHALTVFDSQLIAGGDFTRYISAWDGSTWSDVGPGMNDRVVALTVFNSQLIAGGYFTTAGGTTANFVAAWDGSSWSALGSGMNGSVEALAVFNSQLIAGGQFTIAGGTAMFRIAAWDGSSWSALGTGMNGTVYALTVFNSQLIAGGAFTTAGGTVVNRIAVWDGSSWSALGTGMNNGVQALTVFNSQLIAGGAFTTAGGTTANYIAAWNGSSWSTLGAGMNSSVHALTGFDSQLIAGGYFIPPQGGTYAGYIANWDGSSWSALGGGMDNYVHALTVFNSQLVAGGQFTTAGGTAANRVAVWDGSAWSPLGSGLNSIDFALTVFNSQLITGGWFTTAGGKPSAYVGAWAKGGSMPSCAGFSGLFCDDFEDGASPLWQSLTGSQPGSCTWSVNAGAYGTSTSGTDQLCIRSVLNPDWRNYIYEVDVRGNAGVDKEVTFRSQDGLNAYDVNLVGDPINQLHLNKVVDGVSTILATVPFASQAGQWYHLRIACVGSEFTISVDEVEILNFTDQTAPFYTGGIGLVCWTGATGICDVSFDNVRVTEVASPPPATPQITAVLDAGTGSDLVVKWTQPNLNHVTDFEIGVGTSAGVYTVILTQAVDQGTGPYTKRIPDLEEHTPYYVAIRAHDASNDLWSEYAAAGPVGPHIPIVLVHGWRSGSIATWDGNGTVNDFKGWLESSGFTRVLIPALTSCGPIGESNFDLNAQALAQSILGYRDDMESETGLRFQEVDIVAHSMGGLVSRRLVADPAEFGLSGVDIRDLVMLGTPNGGTPEANWFCDPLQVEPNLFGHLICRGPAGCELSEKRMKLFNQDYNERGTTKFYAIAGTACCGFFRSSSPMRDCPSICFLFGSQPHDGIVSQQSVFVIPVERSYTAPVTHSGLTTVPDVYTSIVLPILMGTPPVNQLALASVPPDSATRQVTHQRLIWGDSLNWVEDTISVGAASSILFYVNPMSSDVEVSLQTPEGVIIDSAQAAADSSNSSYFNVDGNIGYWLASPHRGSWIVRLRTRAWQDSVSPVWVFTETDSDLRLRFYNGSPEGELLDTIRLYAGLEDAVGPVVGAEVVVRLSLSGSDSLWMVTLMDDGADVDSVADDGIYSGQFSSTEMNGFYALRCQATGIDSEGAPFSRLSVLEMFVTGRQRGDMNADGNFDIVDVVLLINHAFRGAPPPYPDFIADVNCDGLADIVDVVGLINCSFRGGLQPSCP